MKIQEDYTKAGGEHQRFLRENKGYKKDKKGFKEKTLLYRRIPGFGSTAEVGSHTRRHVTPQLPPQRVLDLCRQRDRATAQVLSGLPTSEKRAFTSPYF